jgi:hypothetical protein
MTNDEMWENLIDNIVTAIDECVAKGEPCRLTIGADGGPVTIDIYKSKATMKKFDELALGMVKEKTGIDLAPNKKCAE